MVVEKNGRPSPINVINQQQLIERRTKIDVRDKGLITKSIQFCSLFKNKGE